MTTRQSTTLHLDDPDNDQNGIAFSTIETSDQDPTAEYDPVLEIWGTILAPDNQVLTAKLRVPMPDVRDLQSYLNDQFGRTKIDHPPVRIEGAEAQSSFLTQQDNDNAMFFKDGWMACLREVLALVDAGWTALQIQDWAKNQLSGYVGPAALSPDAVAALKPGVTYPFVDGDVYVLGPEVFIHPSGEVLCYQGRNYVPQASEKSNPVEYEPTTGGELLGEQSNAPSSDARQCAHISNGVQCQYTEHGPETMHSYEMAVQFPLPLPQETQINVTPQDLSGNPRSAQHPDNQADEWKISDEEANRKRRLKVEIAFDDALADWTRNNTDPAYVEALNAAYEALRKREPNNSRFHRPPYGGQSTLAPVAPESQQPDEVASLPQASFAAEPMAVGQGEGDPWKRPEPALPNLGYDPALHAAEEEFQRADGTPATSPGANYMVQANHPSVQQMAQQFGGYDTEQTITVDAGSPILQQPPLQMNPQAQQAAQAFPCQTQASDGRWCLRPAGHEIQTQERPATAHVYATDPALLNGPHGFAPGGVVQPAPHLQAVPAFVPPQAAVPQQTASYQDEPMPAAPQWPTPQQ